MTTKRMTPKRLNIPVAKLIAALRDISGLTQDGIGTQCGISSTEISLLERKKVSPTLRTLLKLAQGFGYTLQISFVPKKKTNGVRGPESLHITYELNPENLSDEAVQVNSSPSLQVIRVEKKSA